jgi:mRNA-degrading endonuclease toxin of MazEF toxin-antitoxin module
VQITYHARMARTPDIGGYFEQLTKRGRGGRRTVEPGTDDGTTTPTTTTPTTTVPDGGSPSITERVRDAVVKGREVAKRTADRVRGGSGTSTAKPAKPTEAVVTVEYTPALDGDPDPGDVVWVWVPYEEDATQGKDRPVVVIGRRGDSLVGVPLTTKQHDNEAQVEVGAGDWDPKRRVSYARIWRMLDIDAGTMRREGAVLERDRFDRIIAAVDQYYEVRRAPTPSTGGARRGSRRVDDDDY